MSEERARILQMISEGKITAEEGARLLKALGDSSTSRVPGEGMTRWFRVHVTNIPSGRTKVNVNLPLSLVKTGIKMGARFSPNVDELDWNDLIAAIQEGASGKIFEFENQEAGEKIEIFVE
jgi:hypothetical protein